MKMMSPTSPIYIFNPQPNLQVCYDTRTRTPLYVMERLVSWNKPSSTMLSSRSHRPNFIQEPTLPQMHRSRQSHYHHTGYDRGHMAPAGDFLNGSQAYVSTFTLTNVCPQDPSLNRNLWNQLEQWVRRLVRRDCDSIHSIYVVTGPLWLPTTRRRRTQEEYIADDHEIEEEKRG